MIANPPSAEAESPRVKSSGGSLRQLSFPALGARGFVQYACDVPWQAAGFELAVEAWVMAFETRYSRFHPHSLVSRINAAAGVNAVEVDEEMEELLRLCDALHVMSRGALDPTSLPLVRLWNYGSGDAGIPDAHQIEAARRLVGWSMVERTPGRIFLPQPGMALDFGGFALVYVVDMVAQLAVNHGIPNVLVDFGPGLRALGQPPGNSGWHVGLEEPAQRRQVTDGIGVSGKGVATSGNNLHSFIIAGRHGHIIDPRTGRPVDNDCRHATVIADTCLQAGVLAATALLLGLKDGINYLHGFPGVEGLLGTGSTSASTRGFLKYAAAA